MIDLKNTFGIKNGKAYEPYIGFNKNNDACIKWRVIKGYRGASIESLYRNDGLNVIYGKKVIEL